MCATGGGRRFEVRVFAAAFECLVRGGDYRRSKPLVSSSAGAFGAFGASGVFAAAGSFAASASFAAADSLAFAALRAETRVVSKEPGDPVELGDEDRAIGPVRGAEGAQRLIDQKEHAPILDIERALRDATYSYGVLTRGWRGAEHGGWGGGPWAGGRSSSGERALHQRGAGAPAAILEGGLRAQGDGRRPFGGAMGVDPLPYALCVHIGAFELGPLRSVKEGFWRDESAAARGSGWEDEENRAVCRKPPELQAPPWPAAAPGSGSAPRSAPGQRRRRGRR